MIFDKKYKEGYSYEQRLQAFRESVAEQKRYNAGQKSKRGYIVITNGTEVKKVDPDLPIPEGWKRGYRPRKGVQVK